MYTYQQRLEYARKLKRLHDLYVIKDNIHLTYKYKNQNKAIHNAHSLQDKIINSIIDDAVYGNANAIKNIDSTIEKLMTSTLENERKRIHHQKDKYVNRAVELNSERYTKILTNRINTEAIKLERKIESELRSGVHNGLSESQTRNVLQEKYQDTAKARIRNIIRDSVHTNESNISFINALNEGYNYKIWMNGRSKGKTRAWHKAKLIAPVPIEDYFDIYGPYGHKESMYPGDLYSGAENVANCRCWLRYTNRRPEGLSKTSNTYNIPNTSYLSPQNKPTNNANKENILTKPLETFKTRISNTTEKVTSKIKNIGGKITSKINHQKTNTKNYNHKREQQKNTKSKIKSIGKNFKNKLLNKKYTKHTTKDGKHTINVKEINDAYEFKKYLDDAYNSQPKHKAWRVDLNYTPEDYIKSGCKMYVTKNGSTVAVKPDGDIISVCTNTNGKKDSIRALLEFTIKNGGTKFDSYSGNYGVYRHCGFEPRSWCEGVYEFYPDSWKKGHKTNPETYKTEHIIFFEYTGKQSKYLDADEFISIEEYKGKDYDHAERIRDEGMKQ